MSTFRGNTLDRRHYAWISIVRAYYTGAHAKLRFQVSGHGNYAQRYVQRATSNAGSEESFFGERETRDSIYFFRFEKKSRKNFLLLLYEK